MGIEIFLLFLVGVIALIAAVIIFGSGAMQRPGKGTEGLVEDDDPSPRHHIVTDEGAGRSAPEEMSQG